MSLPPRLPRALTARAGAYAGECGPLRVRCLMSDRDFSEAIAERGGAWAGMQAGAKSRHGPFVHCTYSEPGGEEALHSLQEGPRVCLLAGWRGGTLGRALRAAARLRPGVAAPPAESAMIEGALAGLEKSSGAPLRHRSVRKRPVAAALGAAPARSPAGDRGRGGIRGAFADADRDGMVIESLRAFAGGSGGPDVTVSRRGPFAVHGGDFGSVYDGLLRPIMGAWSGRRRLFSRRGRSEWPDRKPRPLRVEYGRAVLAGEGRRKRLCALIDGYPRCNYGIVHAGPSHVYISVVDREDNSSLALRSVGDSALAIIPQIKTSRESLLRITEFLASAFCEGAIGEYGPQDGAPGGGGARGRPARRGGGGGA